MEEFKGVNIYAKHRIMGSSVLQADSGLFLVLSLMLTSSCYCDRSAGLKAECFSQNIINHSVSCCLFAM